MEYAIDLRAYAPRNSLEWTFTAGVREGCERFRFNGRLTSLIAAQESGAGGFRVEVESDGECALCLASGDSKTDFPQDAFSDFAFLLPFDPVLPAGVLVGCRSSA